MIPEAKWGLGPLSAAGGLWLLICFEETGTFTGSANKYLEVCEPGRKRGVGQHFAFSKLTCAWCLFRAEARVWSVGWRWLGVGSLWHADLGGRAPCGARTCNDSRLINYRGQYGQVGWEQFLKCHARMKEILPRLMSAVNFRKTLQMSVSCSSFCSFFVFFFLPLDLYLALTSFRKYQSGVLESNFNASKTVTSVVFITFPRYFC